MKKLMFLSLLLCTRAMASWSPPIGIPAPPFGIEDTYRGYDVGGTHTRNGDLVYSESSGGGFYTHYIDNSDGNATDLDNEFGTEAIPRIKFVRNLPAGSVVEVHGGPYNYADEIYLVVAGTASSPVYIRGEETRTEIDGLEFRFMGSYGILEDFWVHDAKIALRNVVQVHPANTSDHIVVRDCNVYEGGVNIQADFSYVVVYDCHLYDHGDAYADGDDDLCGIAFAYGDCHHLWFLDNIIHENGGDSIAGGHLANWTTHHIYVGRNTMWGDGENAVDFKEVTDVIISENIMHTYPTRNASSNGAITVVHVGLQDTTGTKRAWFLFNTMYSASVTANLSADCNDIYYIGNVIYDINGPAFSFHDVCDYYIINNSTYDTNEGVVIASGLGGAITIINNIFGSLEDPDNEKHIDLDADYINDAVVSNNLFQDPMTINTGCDNCLSETDPLFIDASSNDFHLQSTSPAIDAGTSSGAVQQVFDRFEQLYGIDIRKDIAGEARTGRWDIGAYEGGGGDRLNRLESTFRRSRY